MSAEIASIQLQKGLTTTETSFSSHEVAAECLVVCMYTHGYGHTMGAQSGGVFKRRFLLTFHICGESMTRTTTPTTEPGETTGSST